MQLFRQCRSLCHRQIFSSFEFRFQCFDLRCWKCSAWTLFSVITLYCENVRRKEQKKKNEKRSSNTYSYSSHIVGWSQGTVETHGWINEATNLNKICYVVHVFRLHFAVSLTNCRNHPIQRWNLTRMNVGRAICAAWKTIHSVWQMHANETFQQLKFQSNLINC